MITDSRMPGMSGKELVAGLRRLTQTVRTPIILHTAAGDESEIREIAAVHGVARVLTKPCGAQVMLAEITSALGAPVQESFRGIPAHREGLQARIPGYLASCDADVTAIEIALSAGDLASIQEVGHNLKGTGSAYGFSPITRIGDRLESAAKIGDRTDITAQLKELASYLGTIRAARAEVANSPAGCGRRSDPDA